MTSGSNWKDEPHEAILRPKVVNTFQENEEISLSEREELLTLRALLKDVHSRNALFHKQVIILHFLSAKHDLVLKAQSHGYPSTSFFITSFTWRGRVPLNVSLLHVTSVAQVLVYATPVVGSSDKLYFVL